MTSAETSKTTNQGGSYFFFLALFCTMDTSLRLQGEKEWGKDCSVCVTLSGRLMGS